MFTNDESVRLYRGNDFIAEFTPDRRGRFAALPHPPIEIHDFVGLLLEKYEGIDRTAAPQDVYKRQGTMLTCRKQ